MKTVNWNALNKQQKDECLQRPSGSSNDDIIEITRNIISTVRREGDAALRQYSLQFDGAALEDFLVSDQEFIEAKAEVSSEILEAIRFAIKRLTAYSKAQLPENFIFDSKDGVICERQYRPIQRVGLYVPGGTASLVSTLTMLAVPAQVAGCGQKILCSPPNKMGKISPFILAAAYECGISQVFKLGGAQAIAAMAYGTQSIPKVDKIFGPGNRFVTQAKMICSQDEKGASIDLPAGPSEILIIADSSANPIFVAADLLSQAEHDSDSQVLLLTTSEDFVAKVMACLQEQLSKLPRKEIATKALEKSIAIIVDSIPEAIEISNLYAPEHLSLQVQDPRQYICFIQNAGTVFLDKWTAESLGDYVTGANHVLPTAGFARMESGLSVLDFMKMIGVQEVTRTGFSKLGSYAQTLATLEQLQGHANAVTVRLNEIKQND
ncbi:MAG: histidinol dehydrogenase [Gammaproteobacteria bacterium]|jgi:histidinol dehydrogenase|nr:histidinol dehydrogenase [Gammaproteobacteria bacterium]